uniref:Uncharacterized protein n=1 Tax=Oryzias latipes TaxID=8090 RepID=A0A3P9LNK6_ORYLA
MLNKAPKLKSTIRAKAKGHVNIGPASEAMVATSYTSDFLAEEAKAKAFEERSATIRGHHVRAVSKKVLKKARG